MKYLGILFSGLLLLACGAHAQSSKQYAREREQINSLLDSWHRAAAQADFDAYFAPFAEDGIFMGTDPGERWDKEAFMDFSRPYFERGKAWSFTPHDRFVYFADGAKTAWFDEQLDTPNLGPCRGSGVLLKRGGQWKIVQYNLAMTIPNELVDQVLKLEKSLQEE